MKTCTLSINNKKVTVEAGTTILEAAKLAGYYIPTLCNHPDQAIKA
ncbi:MAG TPA: 2Fe-2S iron-sulfur cluster binding domain-containing protein, partial [Tissierellia bacterium]|nr:2Fe-2S iron-sulfur cluster binding domain-containing protein [Tissierellia bacterium]